MRKALEIAGDNWHAPAVIHRAIGSKLERRGWEVQRCFGRDIPFANLCEYDLVILSRYALDDEKDNRLTKHLWITPDQERQLEQYVLQGGSILFHHDGISHYPKGRGVSNIARAFRIDHPPIGPIVLRTVENPCNIGATMEPLRLEDEEFNLEIDESKVHVFLVSESDNRGRHLQGWYHRYGEGRVAVFIPGHEDAVLRLPEIGILLDEVLNWLISR